MTITMMNSDKTGVSGLPGMTSLQPTGPPLGGPDQSAQAQDSGAAFRALLERLEQTAQDLDAASEAIDDPRQLGQVVESARKSVEEAVMAGSDLLEAYRAAQARASSSDSPSTLTETKTDRPRAGHGEAR